MVWFDSSGGGIVEEEKYLLDIHFEAACPILSKANNHRSAKSTISEISCWTSCCNESKYFGN